MPTATTAGTGAHASSLWFNGGDSRVDVPPSADLADLRGLRVRVRFQMPRRSLWWWWWLYKIPLAVWWPWGWWGNRRHNLIEGHLSFALFVEPDRSIRGTILDGNGVWRGPATPPGVVKPSQWHTVEFGHDGIVSAAIAVDGVTRVMAHDLIGPVRGVGPRGVTIGHWPEPTDVYSLVGWIDEVEVWREEPDPDPVDDCCGSPQTVDKAVDELREEGWDHARAKNLVTRLERFEADLRLAVTGGHPARTAEVQTLAARGSSAIARGDATEAVAALGGTLQLFANRLSASQQNAFLTQATDLLRAMPLSKRLLAAAKGDVTSRAWLSELAEALCLPVPDDRDPKGDERREPVRVRTGDPRTDAPDDGGDEPPGEPLDAIVGWEPKAEERERSERAVRRRRGAAEREHQKEEEHKEEDGIAEDDDEERGHAAEGEGGDGDART